MSNGQHYDWAKLMRQVGGKIDSRRLRLQRAATATAGPNGPADLAHEPFECPSCGDRLPIADRCPRCYVAPIDLRTGVCNDEWVRAPAHGIGITARVRAALVAATTRTRLGAARGLRPARIGESHGRLRLVGTVSVLRPVVDPVSGEPCGGFARLREVVEPCDHREGCRQAVTLVREQTAVGLLALRCERGVVLVGVSRSVQRVAWLAEGREGDPVVRDGHEVHAIGFLERRAVELPAMTDYRQAPPATSLCLVGTAGSPGWLLV